jgi:hypothetical protein
LPLLLVVEAVVLSVLMLRVVQQQQLVVVKAAAAVVEAEATKVGKPFCVTRALWRPLFAYTPSLPRPSTFWLRLGRVAITQMQALQPHRREGSVGW